MKKRIGPMARSKLARNPLPATASAADAPAAGAAAGEIAIVSNMNIDFAEFHRRSRPEMIQAYRMLLDLHLQEGFAGSYGITGRTLEVLHDEAPDVVQRMKQGMRAGLPEFLSYTQYFVNDTSTTE